MICQSVNFCIKLLDDLSISCKAILNVIKFLLNEFRLRINAIRKINRSWNDLKIYAEILFGDIIQPAQQAFA